MNDSVQTGVAMALISLASGALGLLAGVIRDRDKLKYDVKLLTLSTQNEKQEGQIATLTTSHADCERRQAATEARINQLVEMIAGSGSKHHLPVRE